MLIIHTAGMTWLLFPEEATCTDFLQVLQLPPTARFILDARTVCDVKLLNRLNLIVIMY